MKRVESEVLAFIAAESESGNYPSRTDIAEAVADRLALLAVTKLEAAGLIHKSPALWPRRGERFTVSAIGKQHLKRAA